MPRSELKASDDESFLKVLFLLDLGAKHHLQELLCSQATGTPHRENEHFRMTISTFSPTVDYVHLR